MPDQLTPPSPPHLARLELREATPGDTEEFFGATLRGFHDDYVPDLWTAGRGVFEPDRNFGFAVDGHWISTCGAYSRQLTVPGGSVPVAAVTFVTVQPSYRRRGLLRRMMAHQLFDIQRRGREPVALLWASESSIYGRFGYGLAVPQLRLTGPTPRTAFVPHVELGAGSVGEVPREVAVPVIKDLHRSWLKERPGGLDRTDAWWEVTWHDPDAWRRGASALRFALHYAVDGRPDGYLAFRVKQDGPHAGAEVRVVELDAADGPAYAALWRFVLDLDLVRSFERTDAPIDEPLLHLLADPRVVEARLQDATYLRVVDLPAALRARSYLSEVDLVLGVTDPMIPGNDGRFRLRAPAPGTPAPETPAQPITVERTDDEAEISLDIRELGSLYLGGVSPYALSRAGLVAERTLGALDRLAAAFSWPRPPFCHDPF